MAEFEVYLQGGSPWGFRLQGGKEFRLPLKISKVEPGGKAGVGGVRVGDHVTEINGNNTNDMYHTEALTTVKKAQYSLSLVLKRPEENEEDGHHIQSVSIAPEQSQTRVSLTIGSKSAPSSPKNNRKFNHYDDAVDNAPKKKNVPSGQAYMHKFMGNVDDTEDDRMDDLPPSDRERSKTLPKSYGKKRQEAKTTDDYRSQDDYSSKSLPRSKSAANNEQHNKAPHWYKDMYKQMHTSMEGESHLSKLLSSDAKRGAFRKYDGASSGVDYRAMSPEERRKTFENNALSGAPRRLQGGGRSIATHQHRKSLPNIHASNFNFMSPANYQTPSSTTTKSVTATVTATATATATPSSTSGVTMRVNSRKNLARQKSEENVTQKPSNTENRKSINSEWYRMLQKGGDIPEGGLASAKPTSKSAITVTSRPHHEPTSPRSVNKPRTDVTDGPPQKTSGSSFGHLQASQYMREKNKTDTFVPKDPTTNTKFNAPVDFLELRKRELKNMELEKEREQIREARERERLAEEDRLRKQRELDKKVVQQEKINLEPVLTSPGPGSRTPEPQKSPVQRSPPKEEPVQSELSEFGRAKYSFHPQGPGELEFRKGDTIRIIQGIDENWIEGEYKGNVGIFPVSYVELMPDSKPSTPKQKKQPSPVAIKTTPPQIQQQQDRNNNKWSPPKVEEEPKINGYGPTHHDKAIEEDVIQPTQHEVVHAEPEPEPETQQYSLEEGIGKAKYTFKAESETELSFRKGDMITILKYVDENWYEGEVNDQIGIFPSNYIEVIREPMVIELEAKSPPKAKETKQEKSDIDFEKIFNDVLSEPVSPKTKQQHQQEPEVRPSAHEKEMNHANDARDHNGYHDDEVDSPVNAMEDLVGKGEPHRAVFTYKPTNEDEVELKVGDIVHVLEKCDDGWYIGTSERTGVFGTFPGNYVNSV